MNKEHTHEHCEHCTHHKHDMMLEDSLLEQSPLVSIGASVPDYEFEAYHEKEVHTMKLSDFRDKWLVLFFYPADFTFVCPTELEEMAKLYPKFKDINTEIVSFSTDTVFVHKAWHDTSEGIGAIEYPMGADPSGKISYAFGTLVEGGELSLTEDEGLSLRGTFIIDPKGILRSIEINDNSVGRSGREALRKLQATQYVASHDGKVCPASWQPGDDDLTPGLDLVGKL